VATPLHNLNHTLLGDPYTKVILQGDVMPRGVGVLQRVVGNVRIPIQRLRVARLRHHRVRADEPSQRRVVVAGTVVVEGQGGVPALAGVEAVGRV